MKLASIVTALFGAVSCMIAMAPASGAELAPTAVAADRGLAQYQRNCAVCHARGGTGAIMLTRRIGAEKSLLDQRNDLTPEYIRFVVRRGLGSMPWLSPVELPESELAALVRYLTRDAAR